MSAVVVSMVVASLAALLLAVLFRVTRPHRSETEHKLVELLYPDRVVEIEALRWQAGKAHAGTFDAALQALVDQRDAEYTIRKVGMCVALTQKGRSSWESILDR